VLWLVLGRAPAADAQPVDTLAQRPPTRAPDAAVVTRTVADAGAQPAVRPPADAVATPLPTPQADPIVDPALARTDPAPRDPPHRPRNPRKPRSEPTRPPPVREPPPVKPPPVVETRPTPAPTPAPQVERPRTLSAEASAMIRELDRALAGKGLLPDDALELWPDDYRSARAVGTDDGQRRALVDRLQASIQAFTFRKSFISTKLTRVQAAYHRVRPRLDNNSDLFRGLEAQSRQMLDEYKGAGTDPVRLAKVNSSMNMMLLSLREAQR
jgi:hypothetical protein